METPELVKTESEIATAKKVLKSANQHTVAKEQVE